uniref:Ddb1 and cul4 associated factor 13 n=1 Tax=Erpetoichthys calabaricus TaxID=27687 RepID=A0A8C4STZ2_ERPCA
MKVKVLSRNPDDYIRETTKDIHRVPRNYDPSLHPFEVPREYTRALNATKLERVFAKPFVASLDGHRDGINCMAKHTRSLSTLLSGACDGEVGDDKIIKHWSMEGQLNGAQEEPLNSILGKTVYTGIDHHWSDGIFATCSQQVDIWDEHRSSPIRSFSWGADSITSVKFNPSEVNSALR